MLDEKTSTIITKAKGSLALRGGLQTGDIKAIAIHFNETYAITLNVISGKHFGSKDIVECAERIVAFYKKVKLTETVTEIINSYEKAN